MKKADTLPQLGDMVKITKGKLKGKVGHFVSFDDLSKYPYGVIIKGMKDLETFKENQLIKEN